jgi:hypothetical protein
VCDNSVELPTDRIACWWEDAIITTRLRFAAGVCVLSAVLLIGSAGGAIAWADTESGSEPSVSSTSSEGADGAAKGVTPASESAKPVANPLQATLQNMKTMVSSLRILANQQTQTPDRKSKQTESVVPSAEQDTEASGATTTDVIPAAPETTAVASDETAVATQSNVVPPVTNPLAQVATVVEPVAKAVAGVGAAVLKVPGVVWGLPTSPTPVTDVITTVQEMVPAVTNAVVLIVQLPSDLYSIYSMYSMLSVPTVTATTTVGGGVNPLANAPVLGTRASQWDQAAPIFLAGGMALPADIAPLETLGDIVTTGLSNELPASGVASPVQDVIAQSALGSFLEHAVSALFVPASLSALAALALPGVGGLLIICGLGTRIGYRQAKALLEVRRAGIAVFAGPGPLGVVRAGSLIALRPRASGVRPDRALRVVRSEPPRVASLRDQAA